MRWSNYRSNVRLKIFDSHLHYTKHLLKHRSERMLITDKFKAEAGPFSRQIRSGKTASKKKESERKLSVPRRYVLPKTIEMKIYSVVLNIAFKKRN